MNLGEHIDHEEEERKKSEAEKLTVPLTSPSITDFACEKASRLFEL